MLQGTTSKSFLNFGPRLKLISHTQKQCDTLSKESSKEKVAEGWLEVLGVSPEGRWHGAESSMGVEATCVLLLWMFFRGRSLPIAISEWSLLSEHGFLVATEPFLRCDSQCQVTFIPLDYLFTIATISAPGSNITGDIY